MSEGSGSTVNAIEVTADGERAMTRIVVSGAVVEVGAAGQYERDALLLALAVTHEDVARLRGE